MKNQNSDELCFSHTPKLTHLINLIYTNYLPKYQEKIRFDG